MVQDATNPPSFRIYGHDVKYLHWSYKRFLEKEMRNEFEFDGTAIEFYFWENETKDKDED